MSIGLDLPSRSDFRELGVRAEATASGGSQTSGGSQRGQKLACTPTEMKAQVDTQLAGAAWDYVLSGVALLILAFGFF